VELILGAQIAGRPDDEAVGILRKLIEKTQAAECKVASSDCAQDEFSFSTFISHEGQIEYCYTLWPRNAKNVEGVGP
jgi:hypothetical protein